MLMCMILSLDISYCKTFTTHCPSPYWANMQLLNLLRTLDNFCFPHNLRGDTGGVLVQF